MFVDNSIILYTKGENIFQENLSEAANVEDPHVDRTAEREPKFSNLI